MKQIRKLPKNLCYTILDEDITCATACPNNCPHARAIKRATKSARVRVFGGRVSIVWGGRRYYYSVPTSTQAYEGVFDSGGYVTPGIARANWISDHAIMQACTPKRKAQMKATRIRLQAARGVVSSRYTGRVFTVAAASAS